MQRDASERLHAAMLTHAGAQCDKAEMRGAGTFSLACRFVALLYCFSLPFDVFAMVGGRTITFVVALGLVSIALVERSLAVRPRPMNGRPHLALFLAWSFVVSLWGVAPDVSMRAAYALSFQIAVLLVLTWVLPGLWRQAVSAYALGASALSLILLTAGAEEFVDRRTIFGADQNLLALALSVGVAAALSTITGEGRLLVVLGALLAMVSAVGVVATGSRTGLVALLVAVGIFASRASTSRRRARLLFIAVLAAFAFVYSWQHALLPKRISEFVEGGDFSDSSRRAIMSEFFSHQQWVLPGVGLGADGEFLREQAGVYANAHSLLWGIWIELGVLGLLLFVLIAVSSAGAALGSALRWEWIMLMAPVGTFALTLNFRESNILWFVLALGWAARSANWMGRGPVVGLSHAEDEPNAGSAGIARGSHQRPNTPRHL